MERRWPIFHYLGLPDFGELRLWKFRTYIQSFHKFEICASLISGSSKYWKTGPGRVLLREVMTGAQLFRLAATMISVFVFYLHSQNLEHFRAG